MPVTKNGKATRPNKIPIELTKLIDEKKIETIIDLFNKI